MRWFALLLVLLYPASAAASPQSALTQAVADAKTLAPEVAYQTLYLDLSAIPADYRDEAVKVIAFWANSISREYTLTGPRRVSADLAALTLDSYGWSTKTREKLAKIEPYFHVPAVVVKSIWWEAGPGYSAGWYDTKVTTAIPAPWLDPKEVAALYALTQSECPLVRADWWATQVARQLSLNNRQTGVGYYDWLNLKKRDDFDKLVVFDQKKSILIGRDQRAALERSGVAYHDRQIEIFQALTGGYYRTLDADASDGKSNALNNLQPGTFKHKAEELYAPLPNGLFAFFLCNDKGERQDSAPDFISGDTSPLNTSRDLRIHAGLSCVRCHVEGLRPIDDWVRRTFQPPVFLNVADRKLFLDTQRQFFSDLNERLETDRAVYARALAKTNGLTPAQNAKAVAKLWDWYVERPRGPAEVAAEIGVDEKRLVAALKNYAEKKRLLTPIALAGLLRDKPIPLRIEHWEELVPIVQEIMRTYKEP